MFIIIMKHTYVYLIHILFVGPLLMYTASIGRELSTECSDLDHMIVFNLLGIVGFIVLLYHIYKMTTLRN